jgi:hypothetical protein
MKKRKISKRFIKKIKEIIFSQRFLESHKKSNKDFTRQRKLPFPKLVLFMLNIVKQSLQKELTEFYLNFSTEKNITNSAYSQSRMKLNYTAFIELNDAIIKEFYTDNDFKLWRGFRLLGIDGSRIQLPFSVEILESFGYAKNGSNVIVPMAQTSFCLDLLNQMIINSELNRYETSEYDLALKSIEKCDMKDLLIYDRGYGAIWFMLYHQIKKRDFIIRMRRNSIKEIAEFFNSEEKSKIIEITELHENTEKQIKRMGIEFTAFKIRLVKVILDNGEVEVLATSLLDEEKYPNEEFKDIYFLRWGIETEFDHLKNHLMIENFTGLSTLSIAQDFFANEFVANMQQIIIRDVEDELKEEKKDAKYEYKVNRNLSIGFMKDRIIDLITTKNDDEKDRKLEELKRLFKINPTPIRKGRKFPRIFKKSIRKFYMKKKRAV